LARLYFGGAATAFPAFKVSAKNMPFFAVKNLIASGILQSTSLYFALRAILQMFKMVPDHFV
jgi:hypothetical protein